MATGSTRGATMGDWILTHDCFKSLPVGREMWHWFDTHTTSHFGIRRQSMKQMVVSCFTQLIVLRLWKALNLAWTQVR